MSNEKQKTNKARGFVDFVIKRMQIDNGFAAAMRRADNPDTEYQSWEFLAGFNVDLRKPWERLPYCTVGAAIAKAKPEYDGSMGLGQAIARCYKDGNSDSQAKAKLRRLLACDTVEETCLILRPLLSLIASRGVQLSYGELLNELGYFGPKIKSIWAQNFYGSQAET